MRAAELLDDGCTDAAVATALNAEFKLAGAAKLKPRAVMSFRHADYEQVRQERQERRDAAAEARLVIEAARDAGATFAQAGTDLLAKMFYDFIRAKGSGMEGKELIALGRSLAKFREVDIAQVRAQAEADKAAAAAQIRDVVDKRKLTGADLVAEVDRIMGIRP